MLPHKFPPAVIGLVALDYRGDQQSWTKLGVFTYHGQLPRSEGEDADEGDTLDCPAILRRAAELGLDISSAGNGSPGQRFADEPWIQVFERIIIITQSGGLDV